MIEFLKWLGENNWYLCNKGWFTTQERPYVTEDARKYYNEEQVVEFFKNRNNMAKTSTDWLIDQLELYYNGSMEFTYREVIDLAKTFHKKEVKDAYNQGYREGLEDCGNVWMTDKDVKDCSNAENYYNETFKSTKL